MRANCTTTSNQPTRCFMLFIMQQRGASGFEREA